MTDLAYRQTDYDRLNKIDDLLRKLRNETRAAELDYLQEQIAKLTKERELLALESGVAVEAIHREIVATMGWESHPDGTFTHEHLGAAYSLEGAVKFSLATYQAVTISLDEAKAKAGLA